ncbi:urease accessory protein UreE [Halomicroarcula sp. F13]|uniref:Urease accessory protein UreE n=1 Tax=Haloarcula rubra TaxID=2487747 RepID=A0AAW4PM74_9EURY|nr:urease accessory protein UreE [Halomicroarcula rubra]MBX0322172.1 urease accessory protein UreE [Halomicroarcula rubra]
MLVAETYLGHREDADLSARLADADPVRVVLSDTERRRSRVRTESTEGEDVGIVVARDLADGDVLETDDGTLLVVELATIEALVLDFSDANVSPTAALELGHALGNRHWDLAMWDGEALFPVPDTRERMLDAVEDDLPPGVTTRFEDVPPTTFDDGAEHSHGGEGHSHGDHGHDDGHTHSHGHDHSHGVRTIDGDDR